LPYSADGRMQVQQGLFISIMLVPYHFVCTTLHLVQSKTNANSLLWLFDQNKRFGQEGTLSSSVIADGSNSTLDHRQCTFLEDDSRFLQMHQTITSARSLSTTMEIAYGMHLNVEVTRKAT
jgi:hypothetical protein